MAKMLLLEVPDDVDADALVEHLVRENGEIGEVDVEEYGHVWARVRGVFKWPTQFCECPEETRDKSGKSARGTTYGWYVKRCCNKPARLNAQHPHNLIEATRPLIDRNYNMTGYPGRD
jgi:hypothetical protein